MNFAIIGASGNVGRKTIEILEKSKIPFKELFLVASEKSAGKKIKFRGKEIKIEKLENYDFSKEILDFSNISIVFLPTFPDAPIIAKFI